MSEQATAAFDKTRLPCRLGYEEHDGSRYCHEHGGFAHFLMFRTLICDRARRADSEAKQ